jgi:hypothetical protein
MLSTSLFSQNGTRYKQSAVFSGDDFTLNRTALAEIGLPALTGSNAWYNLTSNLAIGGLIAHCFLFWGKHPRAAIRSFTRMLIDSRLTGPYVLKSVRQARDKTQPDPHWRAMQRYKEAPHWWYLIVLALSFFAGTCVATTTRGS